MPRMAVRRYSFMAFAACMILAACDGSEPSSPRAAPAPKPHRPHSGYFIEMPLRAVLPRVDVAGGAVINVTSNLPDGTLAYITHGLPGEETHNSLLRRFAGGTLRLLEPLFCSEPSAELARGFDIQVAVVPDLSLIRKAGGAACRSLANCGAGPLQPHSVQAILGSNFERLSGDEVTTIVGIPALVASAHYAWPKRSCREPLEISRGAPPTCPPSAATINEDEGGQNLKAVVESVAILLRTNRTCDLYNFTTRQFQKAITWSEFRDRFLNWTKKRELNAFPRGRFKKAQETVGLAMVPRFVESDYRIPGKRKLVHARYVARVSGTGDIAWEIAEFEFR